MDREYEIRRLWELSCTKKNGWEQNPCPVLRSGYGGLESRWKTLTKAKAEHQRDDLMRLIEGAIQNQTTFRRQQKVAQQWIPQPVGIQVWLKDKRWMDDVVIEGEKEQVFVAKRKCRLCDEEVMGPNFSLCQKHYSLKLMEAF